MALVELETFFDGMAAEMARGRLAAEGIESVLFDAGLSSLGIGTLTPVRLMVDEEDEAAARRVLDAEG
ncbi:MAG: DUF2007 domain-containing protein [Allosphingosinicella sp.]